MAKLSNINTLKDLKAFRANLKQSYDSGGERMINAIKSKLTSPLSLLKNNKGGTADSGKKDSAVIIPIVEQVAMGIVGLVLPRKMGFVAR